MEFALNYSPQAAALLRAGAVEIDLFKCPDWDDLIAEAAALCPVYVHFPLMVGGGLGQVDWDRVERQLNSTRTAFVNAHFAPSLNDFPGGASDAQVLDQLCSDVGWLTARFGAERVIIENAPYPGEPLDEGFLPQSADPRLLHQVLEATGAGFLLDLSHARLSAMHLDVEARAYIESLPIGSLRELHVTGLQPVDGLLRDHMHLSALDWEFTEWAVERIRAGAWQMPKLMAFEYGGVSPMFDWRSDSAVIETQVPRLYALAKSAAG